MTEDRLRDVWTTRDRPVLVEVVRHFDEHAQPISVDSIAEVTGLSQGDVMRAARNLMLGKFVAISGDGTWFMGISGEALRVTGLWPDAGDAFDRLIWSLEQRISEAPPEEKGRLRKLLDAVVGVGRDVGVEVLGAAITGRIPM